MRVAYWIFKVVLSPFFFLLWRVKVEGREHIPAHGPAVLAANHQSFCDSFFLPLVLRRRVTYVAKAEYFDSWKTAWFFRAAGQIPMSRSGGDASQRALDTATAVLGAGRRPRHLPRGDPGPGPPPPQGPDRVWPGSACGCDVPVIPVGLMRDPGGPAPREQVDAAVPHGDRPVRPPVVLRGRRRQVTTGQCADPVAGRRRAGTTRPGGAAGTDRRPHGRRSPDCRARSTWTGTRAARQGGPAADGDPAIGPRPES